ncbi:VPLPA-CTERM sorting domain-containing protein [Ponticoccus sp. SC2-23]|uniref:VPLPA-CTERM sorting domain-containing protein n=1 Tax=Alexandriicola marinus TaxID=2081710 RepID=UPI000FDABA07|nr:VPLPA-CTERM sorting domain-containing protein [Alexandriicola marinus]MBM1222403.1 VPLPA-CTERM sorting domain-containing protein [Ponticoccus sp. SC6-9]MBM1224516.1 VPLPA-CTERM sorting domain-containing protein [Ponticoccus sp. SC6-15]MBM1229704.1 VPLPA-CTERM sorting domain-containing protein [Ponticoccus sp. SC6-38]MBM1233482.1 VPLPA-CTERM sorting domain-containing protein [Ponticoccus sp. SC6-45]MBM1236568.1 VPLPA-CTERM sorting domain-containing protein [Ponticoccus sp. SC6-49]MBM1244612
MRHLLATLAFIVASFTAAALPAGTVVLDDAVFGTDTVLRDTDNNVEFLRLDLTMGYGYSAMLGEFGAGGDFEGWSVATTAVMNALGASVGITHGSTDAGQIALAEWLRDWFCPVGTCVDLSSTHEYARGLVSDSTQLAGRADAFTIGRRFNVTPEQVDFRVSGYDFAGTSEQVWLMRSVAPIPLPASALLLVLGLGGLGLVRRRKTT